MIIILRLLARELMLRNRCFCLGVSDVVRVSLDSWVFCWCWGNTVVVVNGGFLVKSDAENFVARMAF